MVTRTNYNEVRPRVDYHVTPYGQQRCPAPYPLLVWRKQPTC